MSDKIYLKSTFAYREDTLENWETVNPVLEKGEPAIVRDGTDGRWLKIGDGATPFSALPWKTGPKGDKGDKGDTGEKGDTGAIGPQGIQGPQGLTGATGPRGLKGDKGDKGDTGATGEKGEQGPKGEQGDAYVLTEEDKAEIAGIVLAGFTNVAEVGV